ncbi:hypothetical protein [Paenibacillus kobensis]|uniref:hypothetical protein n=1 Tax=Paenibacillus kobensis TaxID=59841 RepID=UPI000FD73943|nr:hypothetical protein [Paenibacillus kobensis]
MKKRMLSYLSSVVMLTLVIFPLSSAYAAPKATGSLSISTNSITLSSNGTSEFVDVLYTAADGTTTNVNTTAHWESSDENVAVAYDGRVLARGKGSATINVSYMDSQGSIRVKVSNKINLEALVLSGLTSTQGISAFSLTTSDRDTILNRASAMYGTSWKPTKNLIAWDNKKIYYAGTAYSSIPYSQGTQVDGTGFVSAMSKSDFYTNTTGVTSAVTQPRYGNDCSGFTSFAWGITRQTTSTFYNGIVNGTYSKVGSYDPASPTSSDLISSYASLDRGDAINSKVKGHVLLVGRNMGDYVIAYEQTPPELQITIWDYTDLASGKYLPFTKK